MKNLQSHTKVNISIAVKFYKEYCNSSINCNTYGRSCCYVVNLNEIELIKREREREKEKKSLTARDCEFAFYATSIVV